MLFHKATYALQTLDAIFQAADQRDADPILTRVDAVGISCKISAGQTAHMFCSIEGAHEGFAIADPRPEIKAASGCLDG